MKFNYLHLYLIIAVITFGDIITQPAFQKEDSPKQEDTKGIAVFVICATWPLWWSGRFFNWVKQSPAQQEAAQ